MGNKIITIDTDEENFRLGIKMFDEKLENYLNSESFIKRKQIMTISEIPNPIAFIEFNYADIKLFVFSDKFNKRDVFF